MAVRITLHYQKVSSFCLLAILNSFIIFSGAHNSCPCDVNFKNKTAKCSGRSLKAVPGCLPNTLRELIFSNNSLAELKPGQFERFRNLSHLDISNNGITRACKDSFKGLFKLSVLDAAKNQIQVLQNSIWKRTPSLKSLSFYKNRLTTIEDYAFSALSELTHLNLAKNQLSFLRVNMFHKLSNLKVLILDNNPLYFATSFPDDIFHPLSSLEELHIARICPPSIFNCTYIDKQLRRIPSLRRLYISGLTDQILGDGFATLTKLEELYMGDTVTDRNCRMTEISWRTFKNIWKAPLRKLSLANCGLSAIMPRTFALLRNLTFLDVSGNLGNVYLKNYGGIANVTKGLNETNIKYLNVSGVLVRMFLSYCDVEGLTNTNLETLDFSRCAIELVVSLLFTSLPKTLKHLYLNHNYLFDIELDCLDWLDNLLTLDLSNQRSISMSSFAKTDYEVFDPRVGTSCSVKAPKYRFFASEPHSINFTGIPDNIVNLRQSINTTVKTDRDDTAKNINAVQNVKFNKFHDSCLNLPDNLTALDISYSPFLYVVLSLCDPRSNVRVLNVANQRNLDFFNSLWNALNMFPNLETLDVSRNFIKEIPKNAFSHTEFLKRLILAKNSLVTVGFDILTLTLLEHLDLSNNRIQLLSDSFTSQVETVAKSSNLILYLQNNILQCKCENNKFVSWLRHTRVLFDKRNLQCEFKNDSKVSLSRISDINKLIEEECIANMVLAGCAGGFVSLTLLISVIAITYFRRWRFKYLLSVGKRNINPFHPLEQRQIETEHNIYISYDCDFRINSRETLHELVTANLYPRLNHLGFTVLIRDELDIGKKLYEVISQAIRKSRNVIVLLSKDYCNDHWNVFEFNMAVMEGIYTKRLIVIPILLENIRPGDLHEEIYMYLRSEPVAKIPCNSQNGRAHLIEYVIDSLK